MIFMNKIRLRLFITGHSKESLQAVSSLKKICSEELSGQADLEVVDVMKDTDLAKREKIFSTPTLIKESPKPRRRIVGDLADYEKLLTYLSIEEVEH